MGSSNEMEQVDLIDRQTAIDVLAKFLSNREGGGAVWWKPVAESVIDVLPSAQPERKTGKWERHNTYHGDDVSGYIDPDWRCSECGRQANVNAWCLYDLTDFCPNCGARMMQEGEDNERA